MSLHLCWYALFPFSLHYFKIHFKLLSEYTEMLPDFNYYQQSLVWMLWKLQTIKYNIMCAVCFAACCKYIWPVLRVRQILIYETRYTDQALHNGGLCQHRWDTPVLDLLWKYLSGLASPVEVCQQLLIVVSLKVLIIHEQKQQIPHVDVQWAAVKTCETDSDIDFIM